MEMMLLLLLTALGKSEGSGVGTGFMLAEDGSCSAGSDKHGQQGQNLEAQSFWVFWF